MDLSHSTRCLSGRASGSPPSPRKSRSPATRPELPKGRRSQPNSPEPQSPGSIKWPWLKFPGIPKWVAQSKWKHGPKPAVCPSCSILSHTQMVYPEPCTGLRRRQHLWLALSLTVIYPGFDCGSRESTRHDAPWANGHHMLPTHSPRSAS